MLENGAREPFEHFQSIQMNIDAKWKMQQTKSEHSTIEVDMKLGFRYILHQIYVDVYIKLLCTRIDATNSLTEIERKHGNSNYFFSPTVCIQNLKLYPINHIAACLIGLHWNPYVKAYINQSRKNDF